ncbi:hypothetical protein EYV94_09570 [Puteibacter caeruleilacunae]|nr:hypothetical protein EYV94_09570 [Puteibacter caeruleilacunae]
MKQIISVALLLLISLISDAQDSNYVKFDGDTCCYIKSVGMGSDNLVVLYSNNKGTWVTLGKMDDNRHITFNSPVEVSYGVISKTDIVCKPGCDPVDKREGIQDIPLKVLKLTDEQFVIFYEDDKDPDENKVRLGKILDGKIVLGEEQKFGNSGIVGTQGFDAIRLSEDKFVVAFNDDLIESREDDNQIVCALGKVSGDDASIVQFSDLIPLTSKGNDAISMSMARTSGNQFLVTFSNRCNDDMGECILASVRANSIDVDAKSMFTHDDVSGVNVIALEDKSFVINYGVDSPVFGEDYGYSKVGKVVTNKGKTEIVFGNEYIFNPEGGTNNAMDGIALGENSFALFWSLGKHSISGKVVIGKLEKLKGKNKSAGAVDKGIIFSESENKPVGSISNVSMTMLQDDLVFCFQDLSSSSRNGCASVASCKDMGLVVSGTQDLEGLNQDPTTVSVYPTITTGFIDIKIDNLSKTKATPKYHVFSVAPVRKVIQGSLEEGENRINIGSQPDGYYVISVQIGDRNYTNKVRLHH